MSFILALLVVLGSPLILFGLWVLFDGDGSRAQARRERKSEERNEQYFREEELRRNQQMLDEGQWVQLGDLRYTVDEWQQMYRSIEEETQQIVDQIIIYEGLLADSKRERDKYRKMYGSGGLYNKQVREYQNELIQLNRRLDSITPNPYELNN